MEKYVVGNNLYEREKKLREPVQMSLHDSEADKALRIAQFFIAHYKNGNKGNKETKERYRIGKQLMEELKQGRKFKPGDLEKIIYTQPEN